MGARLVAKAIAYAVDVPLKPNEFRLLVGMSLTALDQDSPPRYFDSREASSITLGRRVRDEVHPDDPDHAEIELERNAAFSAVKQAVSGLIKLQAIRRLRMGSRYAGRAEFALTLDVDETRATDEFRKRNEASRGRKSLPLAGRESLPLEGRKSLLLGVGDPYPLGEVRNHKEQGAGEMGTNASTSLDPVDNFESVN